MSPDSWSYPKRALSSLAFAALFVFCLQRQIPTADASQNDSEHHRLFVKQMTKNAFGAYVTYAWPEDFLQPLSLKGGDAFIGNHSGFTILHSISTLWNMELQQEYELARSWIAANLTVDRLISSRKRVVVSDIVTSYIGGLLSSFRLTGDRMFLDKARQFASALEPAYDSETGLPYARFNPQNTSEKIGASQPLSSVFAQQLEYFDLANVTGESKFVARANKIRTLLHALDKPKGLYQSVIDVRTGRWNSSTSTFFAEGREFYWGLLKTYYQTGGCNTEALVMYMEAIDAAEQAGMFVKSKHNGMTYAREYYSDRDVYSGWMKSEGCYLGGMLAQGVSAIKDELEFRQESMNSTVIQQYLTRMARHWKLAQELTETCHQTAAATLTGLPPRKFAIEDYKTKWWTQDYLLSHELAESYFTLWRLTHHQKYRDYAWQLAQAIEKYCKAAVGYSAIRNADEKPSRQIDYQAPKFLSATLKYLYLTFTDDAVLPIDSWIYNAVGHPLPVLLTDCMPK